MSKVVKQSGGILVFHRQQGEFRVLLVHPAGPIWGHRDSWSIPKGELDKGEDHRTAAFREFEEELGVPVPVGDLIDLGSAWSPTGKVNYIWAVEGDIDLTKFSSNYFTMEWPPKSGKFQNFLENDRADWFDFDTARQKLFAPQTVFIDRLADHLSA